MVQRNSPTNQPHHPKPHKQHQLHTRADKFDHTTMETKKPKPKTRDKPRPEAVQTATDKLPNYMKSTTSSAARTEQLQVTSHVPTDAKLKTSKTVTTIVSLPTCASKPAKNLKRKGSFKSVKLPCIKSSANSVSSKLDVNRNTCSSTLKDVKFPKELELSHGATEAEGASVMKVCPYKYCSLNGHRHECLPSVKSFVASKRKLLETQKSMKVKGVSPFRRQNSVKDRKEIDTGQPVARARSNLEIISLIEEVGNDFFVEIYCKTEEEIVKSVNCEERSTEEEKGVVGEPAESEDGVDGAMLKGMVEIHDECEDKEVEDDLDSDSDNSGGEFEGTIDFLEYSSFEQQFEAEKEEFEDLDCVEVETEGCCNEDAVESLAEDGANTKITASEACEIVLEDIEDKSDSSSTSSDDFSGYANIFKDDDLCGEVGLKENVSDGTECFLYLSTGIEGDGSEQSNSADLSDTNSGTDCDQDEIGDCVQANDNAKQSETEEHDLQSTDKILRLCEEENQESEDCKAEAASSEGDSSAFSDPNINSNKDIEDLGGDVIDQGDDGNKKEEIGEANCTDTFTEENADEMQTTEQDTAIIEDDQSNLSDSQFCSPEELYDGKQESKVKRGQLKSLEDSALDDILKLKLSIMRNKMIEEMDEMDEFNPRGPNFLPVEPDPESEKVDLRHQTIDERRNSEEFMIDFALQRAVTKLGSARRRKVALLVEAFETVAPLPMCSRPLQACN